jgi:hypothetical protein
MLFNTVLSYNDIKAVPERSNATAQ